MLIVLSCNQSACIPKLIPKRSRGVLKEIERHNVSVGEESKDEQELNPGPSRL